MRLKITKSQKSTRLYAIKSVYDSATRKTTSKVAAKLGTAEEIMEREGLTYDEAIEWARDRIAEMSSDEAEVNEAVSVRLRPSRRIGMGERRCVNAGLLFPKKTCVELGVAAICNDLVRDEDLDFDLGETVENLVAARMLIPAYTWTRTGEYATCPGCRIITPSQEYRAISALARHADELVSTLREASVKLHRINPSALYFNSLSFRFSLFRPGGADAAGASAGNVANMANVGGSGSAGEGGEGGAAVAGAARGAGSAGSADGISDAAAVAGSAAPTAESARRQMYNAAVQAGVFVDADGFPLSFSLGPLGKASNPFLQTQEQTMSERFGKSRFVVCVDDVMSLESGRLLGGYDFDQRDFTIEHDVRRMRPTIRSWISEPQGWHRVSDGAEVDLREVEGAFAGNPLAPEAPAGGYFAGSIAGGAAAGSGSAAGSPFAANAAYALAPDERPSSIFSSSLDDIFYKERWHVTEGNLPQRYFALFSPRRRRTMMDVRTLMASDPLHAGLDTAPGAFPGGTSGATFGTAFPSGEPDERFAMSALPFSQLSDKPRGVLLSADTIRYDGYSCFVTTLSSSPASLARKALYRQQCSERLLLTLTGLPATPDFPSNAECMRGHFMLSYLAFVVYARMRERLSAAGIALPDEQLMALLRSMNMLTFPGEGYVPTYVRTPLTDALHDAFGLRTDSEILTQRKLRSMLMKPPPPDCLKIHVLAGYGRFAAKFQESRPGPTPRTSRRAPRAQGAVRHEPHVSPSRPPSGPRIPAGPSPSPGCSPWPSGRTRR